VAAWGPRSSQGLSQYWPWLLYSRWSSVTRAVTLTLSFQHHWLYRYTMHVELVGRRCHKNNGRQASRARWCLLTAKNTAISHNCRVVNELSQLKALVNSWARLASWKSAHSSSESHTQSIIDTKYWQSTRRECLPWYSSSTKRMKQQTKEKLSDHVIMMNLDPHRQLTRLSVYHVVSQLQNTITQTL